MSEDEINGYALRVIAQDGNIFYTGEEDTAQRHFISYLKYRGTVIDPSNIKFYWFRENSRVFSNNEKFNQYGGISQSKKYLPLPFCAVSLLMNLLISV